MWGAALVASAVLTSVGFAAVQLRSVQASSQLSPRDPITSNM